MDQELPIEGEDGPPENGKSREFDLSSGPTLLDMDPDEDASVIESATPGPSFETFWDIVIAVALKSLDIPYSFYNERFTNYSGSRTAWLHYERSCADRRADQMEARRRWTLWQLQRWIVDGFLTLPSGMTIGDVAFQWGHAACRGGNRRRNRWRFESDRRWLDNPQRICHERDRGDVFDNIDRTIDVIKYAREQGIAELGEPLVSTGRLRLPVRIHQTGRLVG